MRATLGDAVRSEAPALLEPLQTALNSLGLEALAGWQDGFRIERETVGDRRALVLTIDGAQVAGRILRTIAGGGGGANRSWPCGALLDGVSSASGVAVTLRCRCSVALSGGDAKLEEILVGADLAAAAAPGLQLRRLEILRQPNEKLTIVTGVLALRTNGTDLLLEAEIPLADSVNPVRLRLKTPMPFGQGLDGLTALLRQLFGDGMRLPESITSALPTLDAVRLGELELHFQNFTRIHYAHIVVESNREWPLTADLVVQSLGVRCTMTLGALDVELFGGISLTDDLRFDSCIRLPFSGGGWRIELRGSVGQGSLRSLLNSKALKGLGSVRDMVGDEVLALNSVMFHRIVLETASAGVASFMIDIGIRGGVQIGGVQMQDFALELESSATGRRGSIEGTLVLGRTDGLPLVLAASYEAGVWSCSAAYNGAPRSLGFLWEAMGGRANDLRFLKDVGLERLHLGYRSGDDWEWRGLVTAVSGTDKVSLELSHGKAGSLIKGEVGLGGGAGKSLGDLLAPFKVTGLRKEVRDLKIRQLHVKCQRTVEETASRWSFDFSGTASHGALDFQIGIAIAPLGTTLSAIVVGPIKLGGFLAALGLQKPVEADSSVGLDAAGFRFRSNAEGRQFEAVARWGREGKFVFVLANAKSEPKSQPSLLFNPGAMVPRVSEAQLRWSPVGREIKVLVPAKATDPSASPVVQDESVTFSDGVLAEARISLTRSGAGDGTQAVVKIGPEGLRIAFAQPGGTSPPAITAPSAVTPTPAPSAPGESKPSEAGQAKKPDDEAEWSLGRSLALASLTDGIGADNKWLSWLKTIGKSLVIDDLGVRVRSSPLTVTVVADVTVNVGPWLSVSVQQAGLTIVPKSLSPEGLRQATVTPRIDGAAVALTLKPWLKLAAAVVRDRKSDDLQISGLGQLEIMERISIGALLFLGWKGKVLNEGFGFIYAKGLNLGDPSFKITGLAGGFGYRRILELPERPEDVATFPIVKLLTSNAQPSGTNALLKDLGKFKDSLKYRETSWCIAVGLTFKIAELVDCLALAVAEIRKPDFELAMIGLADFPLGAKDPTAAALGHIQLAIAARFSSSAGTVKILGALTPESWLFDKECRLSGGFAICAWLTGPHKGDFLVSLGGYSPLVRRKAHYPPLERVGFSWRKSDQLSMSGGMYLTLDRYGIQFGVTARLEFRSDRVTLNASYALDVVMAWVPVSFEAEIRISCQIEIRAFVTLRLSIDVAMQAWGPEFGAYMTVSIQMGFSNVSFAVAVGARRSDEKPPLTFSDILKLIASDRGARPKIQLVGAQVPRLAKGMPRAPVDSVKILLTPVVPATRIFLADAKTPHRSVPDRLDIRPLGLRGIRSDLRIRIARRNGGSAPIMVDWKTWRVDADLAGPPEALWHLPDSGRLDLPSGCKAITGVRMEPPPATLSPAVGIPSRFGPLRENLSPSDWRGEDVGDEPITLATLVDAGFISADWR